MCRDAVLRFPDGAGAVATMLGLRRTRETVKVPLHERPATDRRF